MKLNNPVLVAISLISFLNVKEKLLLSEIIDCEGSFLSLNQKDLENIMGRQFKGISLSTDQLIRSARETCEYLDKKEISALYYWDKEYPPQLREIWDPPFLLYYRGSLPDNDKPAIAVVGTRIPAEKALKAAFRTGFELGLMGYSVVSGLAAGIDSASHRGNIAGGCGTVAVLGCGIDSIYPLSNRRLGEEILNTHGCIFSEYSPGTKPLKYHFPARNRIISGLCRSVIVIQAPLKSGALITADFALDQGRDLFVHRDGLSGISGAGGNALQASGAEVIDSAEEVLNDWGITFSEKYENAILIPGKIHRLYLAELMEKESAGELIKHNGECFRRI